MTNIDWYWRRKIFWLFIICHLSIGIDGHHNDTCEPASGGPGFCVPKRYCREGFKEQLLPCIDGKVCCPLPTTAAPSTTTPVPVLTKPPTRRSDSSPRYPNRDDNRPRRPISPYDKPLREYPSRKPNEYERPKYDPRMDDPQDGRSRRPVISYDRPLEEIPPRERDDRGRPRYPEDDRPPNRENDGRPRRPIYKDIDDNPPRRRRPEVDDYPPVRRPISRDYDDIPSRRPVDSERPRQNRPVDDYPPRRDEGRPRRPISRDYDDIPPRRPIDNERPRQNRPTEDIPPRRLIDSEKPRQNRPIDDYPPRRDEGRPRRPISRDYDDIPPRRPIDSERPRQNRPIDDYPPRRDDGSSRKPVDIYEEPFEDYPKSVREQPSRPVGRPRNEDRIEKTPTKPGKVKFEDEYLYEDKPLERPSGTETRASDNEDDGKPVFSIDPRRERPRQSQRGRNDAEKELPINPRDDDYDRRRPIDDARREPPSNLGPTRDQPRVEYETPFEAPEPVEPQPKVPACGVKPYELFIAGGETSKEHEWPWMAAIFRRQISQPKIFICGGALINTKYVLSAAHCFVNNYVILPASSFVVRLGAHQLNSGEEFTVSELVVHHNHTGSDFFNDIALLKLAGTVYTTDKVAPICLPPPGMRMEDFVGKMATVAGWGDTSFRSIGARMLQHVTIPIVSSEECFAAYSRVRGAAFLARGSDHVICAGLREGGKDACMGDSGGPLMLQGSEDRWIVVGVVSLGYKCAEPGYPGVYTRVTHYMSWIRDNSQ